MNVVGADEKVLSGQIIVKRLYLHLRTHITQARFEKKRLTSHRC